MGRFTNKVVLVLGGATGIGAATIRRLTSEGAHVFLGDINSDGAAALADSVRWEGGKLEAFRADQVDDDSVRDFVRDVRTQAGRIDAVFLNGADTSERMQNADTDAETIDTEIWDWAMRVNARGYLLGMRHAIPALRENGGGPIVCTSSELAFVTNGMLVAYGASKSAINLLVRHTAQKFGKDGIRCNAMAPALILTDSARLQVTPEIEKQALAVTPHVRLGQPEDVAALAAFLLSDDAEFINGQVISINGGTTLR